MSKLQPVVTRYDVLFMRRENDNGTKMLGRSDISRETKKRKKQNKKRTKTVVGEVHVAVGAHTYRRTIERRAAVPLKSKKTKTKTKQNKV